MHYINQLELIVAIQQLTQYIEYYGDTKNLIFNLIFNIF